jgi:hypothetical protein
MPKVVENEEDLLIEELEGDEEEFSVDVEDDTPEEDRGRAPMPKEIVEELEKDDLDEYSDKVKERLNQFKKVYHDERRRAEKAEREREEAIEFARRIREQNTQYKSAFSEGEKTLLESYKKSASLELDRARVAYKEAYESGDGDALLQAQEDINLALIRNQQLENYRPALQEDKSNTEERLQAASTPKPDEKALAWQKRNDWYGQDEEMTATALGVHSKLVRQHGAEYAKTDAYWDTWDSDDDAANKKSSKKSERLSVNVASASRSRATKKVVLTKSELEIASRLGLTKEQYAREKVKAEQR